MTEKPLQITMMTMYYSFFLPIGVIYGILSLWTGKAPIYSWILAAKPQGFHHVSWKIALMPIQALPAPQPEQALRCPGRATQCRRAEPMPESEPSVHQNTRAESSV